MFVMASRLGDIRCSLGLHPHFHSLLTSPLLQVFPSTSTRISILQRLSCWRMPCDTIAILELSRPRPQPWLSTSRWSVGFHSLWERHALFFSWPFNLCQARPYSLPPFLQLREGFSVARRACAANLLKRLVDRAPSMQSLLNEGYENLEAAVGEWHAWSHLQGLGKINLPKLHAAHVEQLVSAAAASLCWCPASLASLTPEFARPADRYVCECPTNSRWLKVACHFA